MNGTIPTAGIPTGTIPTSNIPTGNIPTAGVPTGTIPTGVIPTIGVPTSNISTGNSPTGAIPTAGIPTNTIPTGNIPNGTIPNNGQPSQAQRLYKEIVTPASLKTMGSSLGFGIGAAFVFATLNAAMLSAISSNAISSMMNNLGNASQLLDVKSSNFFYTIITMLIAGVSGSFSLKASAFGISTDALGASISMWLPMSLSGVALLVGAAFGAYFIAHRVGVRFKFTGMVSAAVVGLATGLIYVVLGALFPMNSSTSIGILEGKTALNGATARTFIMAFLISAIGSLLGLALAQYASDSTNVFVAAWRWGHRLRGPARTFVEAFFIYMVSYTLIALIALIIVSIAANVPSAIVLIPIIMPYLQFVLLSFSSFGGIATVGDNAIPITFGSLFAAKPWVFILGAVIFIAITLYIALRASARALQDKYYARWEHTWKAPVGTLVLWLLIAFVLTSMGASSSGSSSGAVTIVSWYPLLAAVWAFAIEVVAMTFGPAMLTSIPGLWQFVRGGCVEPTPQNVNAYVDACGARFRHIGGNGGNAANGSPTPQTPAQNHTAGFPGQNGTPGATPTSAAPMPGQAAPAGAQPFAQPGQNDANPQAYATGSVPNAPYPTGNPSLPTYTNRDNPAGFEDFSTASPVAPVSGAAAKPMDPKQKRIIIIGSAIVGACVLLGIIYSVLNATVFSPKTVVDQYTAAIAAGDFDHANAIADPQVSGKKAALLTNKAAKQGSTISNARVTSTARNSDGSTSVAITYTLSGKTHNETLNLAAKNRELLVFNKWTITTPLVANLRVSGPSAVKELNINGIGISAENSSDTGSSSSDSQSIKAYNFKAYPGTYTVKAAANEYMTGNTLTLEPISSNDMSSVSSYENTITVKATDKLKNALNEEVKKKVDDCSSSTDADPADCPFGDSFYEDNSDYSNFSWSVSSYPEVDDVNMSDSSFSTASDSGEMDLYYQYRFFSGDDWQSDNDKRSIYEMNGTFSIDGNKVNVKFDDFD